jgi:hypothetical protein
MDLAALPCQFAQILLILAYLGPVIATFLGFCDSDHVAGALGACTSFESFLTRLKLLFSNILNI